MCFKPSHFTRDKDGAPSDIVPPLSADADKGDQEPLIYQWASGGGNDMKNTAQTLRSGAEHSYQIVKETYGVRRLTPRECEILQAWPVDWTARRMKLSLDGNLWRATGKIENQTDSPRYKQAGNGVTSSVARWIAERIIQFSK